MFKRIGRQEVKPEAEVPRVVARTPAPERYAPEAEEDLEQEEVAEVKPTKEKPQQEEELTEEKVVQALVEDRNLLINHDARISAIEAALFRLKALV
jgi:hypothetical protein